MGIRIEREPNPNFIVRPITLVHHALMTSPRLIDRLGAPKFKHLAGFRVKQTAERVALTQVFKIFRRAQPVNEPG